MITVYLLRHGETAYNADNNRYCGRTDIPVNEKGMQQALLVQEQLKDVEITAVFSSPLMRAYETAKIATQIEVVKDERLIEADFGLWEGKTREEFVAEIPESWEAWNKDPENAKAGMTGETAGEIVSRMDSFFRDLYQKYETGTFVVTAHNGVNRLFLANKLGMPLKNYRKIVQQNSSLTRFTLDGEGELTLELLNSKAG